MNQWKEYKLKDLCNKIGSGATPSGGSNAYKTEGISLIRSQNVLDFKFSYDGLAFIDEEQADKLKGVKVYPNDILLNITGDSVARACIVPQSVLPARVNQHVAIIRTNELFTESEFVFYYLQFIKSYLLSISEIGGTRNAITKGMLEETNILLPPLPEQRAIASVLSSLDDKIDLLHRQNATLEALAETLFRQWFVEEAEESWEEKSLGEMLTITSSKRIFYSEYVDSGVPFYRSKEIIELRKNGATRSELYISNERFNEIDSKFGSPKEGDILMTSVGTLGVAYRVKATDKFYFKDGNLTWFKDFKDLHSSIVYLWLVSRIGQEQLASIAIGSTQQAFTIEGLKNIRFKIPPKDILVKCKEEFEIIISKIDSNHTQIRTLTQLRDTLLPKLMSGEVRVRE